MNTILKLTAAAGVCALTTACTYSSSVVDTDYGQIRVVCNKSISANDVVLDRPNPEFLEDLKAAGYSAEQASDIGHTICRDPAGLDDEAYKLRALNDLLRNTPPAS